MGKKKEKIYNHYVPQFYLRNFSGNNSIGVYNFDIKKFIDKAAIRNNAGRDFLYGHDTDLENWFQNLEGKWATVINKILQNNKISEDSTEYTYLLMFIYLSDARVAEQADAFKQHKLEEGKSFAKMMVEQGKINLSNEDIDNLDVNIERPNLVYMKGMEKIINVMSDLCPLIIVNESDIGFITSDVPVAKYNQWFLERKYKHPYGFGHIGFQCFVPLSSRICLCLYDDIAYRNLLGNKDRIRLYSKTNVEALNKLFLHNAYKEIYYENSARIWLQENVGQKKDKEVDDWVMGNPKTGYLQKFSGRSVYEDINLNIFKTDAYFKKFPIMYDEAGPIRRGIRDML